MVVETAFDGNADFLVSRDGPLLTLKSFREIKTVDVKQILEALNEFDN
jgi:predicted nucleic acid-binding protein